MKKLFATFALAFLASSACLIADDATDFDTQLRSTHALIKDGKFKEALAGVNQAIKSFPKSPRLYSLRSNINFQLNDYQSALLDMNQVVQLLPNHAKPYVDRAVIYLALKNYAAAEADIEQALKIKPQSAYAYQIKFKIDEAKKAEGAK